MATEELTDFYLRNVQKSLRVGQGAYGIVFDVKYVGTTFTALDTAQVFQAVAGRDVDESDRTSFVQECRIWSAIRHPNIVLFIGLYAESRDDGRFPLLVTEKIPYTLQAFIQGDASKTDHDFSLALSQKLSLLHDISVGLWYLHFQRCPIVHCGLTPDNVLLGYSQYQPERRLQAKITNVGMAKVMKIASSEQKAYLAPEARTDNQLYHPSRDVYSFGKVFLCTAGAKRSLESTGSEILDTELQEYSKGTDLMSLINRSCHEIPKCRPVISEVSEAIFLVQRSSITLNEEVKQKPNARRMHCSHPTDTVNIILGESGITANQPITIPKFFKKTFDKMPTDKALCWKDNDAKWKSITYAEYKELIYNVAKSFLKLGLERYHAVGILGFNSVEWFASSIGAVFAGGLSTGIHATSTSEVCQYILKDCKAHIVVVENGKLLDIIVKIREKLPHLKAIVQYKGELSKDYPDTYTWTKFLELGKDTEDSEIDNIINKQQPNQCAIVLYTSGTTSNPKGVMLSHDNFTWSAMAFLDTIGFETAKSTISYLSSAHMIGTFTDMFLPIPVGGTVCFASSNAIEGSLISTMKKVQPTFFFSTPRVWEKIKQKIEAKLLKNQDTRESNISQMIRKELGLDKCKYISVGAEPVHDETHKYFRDMKVTLLGHYGMSESTLPQTTNLEDKEKLRSCGCNTNGVQIEIVNKDKYKNLKLFHLTPPENDVGEIVCRGRNVFMGYLGLEGKTRETIDDDGWLHTGDIGWLDNT